MIRRSLGLGQPETSSWCSMARVYNKHHGNAPRECVYIGRGSKWGNPFVIGKDGDRDRVCDRFEADVLPTLDVTPLIGRDLVCFCAPKRCHGDSILRRCRELERDMVNFKEHTREGQEQLYRRFYEDAIAIRAVRGANKIRRLSEALKDPKQVKLWHDCLQPLRVFYITPYTLKLWEEDDQHEDVKIPASMSLWFRLCTKRGATPRQLAYMWRQIIKGWSWQAIEGARMVLDKDPRCGIAATSYNKAAAAVGETEIPNLSTIIARGYGYEGRLPEGDWYASRKLDGVRCLLIWREGESKPVCLSRTGHEIANLEVFYKRLEEHVDGPPAGGLVLDGELALRTRSGEDDFKGIQAAIQRKGVPIKNPVLHVFDMLTWDEYVNRKSKRLFTRRQKALNRYIASIGSPTILPIVEQTQIIEGEEEVTRARAYAFSSGWEGLMLRKDAPYVGRKTRDLLKVTAYITTEVKVTGVVRGVMGIGGVDRECVVALKTDYRRDGKKGSLKVGSGLSKKMHIDFYDDPSKIIGCTITIAYKEETEDKRGVPSVRCPRLKVIHGKKRTL